MIGFACFGTGKTRAFLAVLAGLWLLCPPGFSQETEPPEDVRIEMPSDSTEDTVSVNMPQVNIADALRLLAKSTDMSLVVDKNVTGVVDLLLQKVPFQEAWQSLLQTAGLSVETEGGVTRVFPKPQEPTPEETTETRLIQLKFIPLGSPTLSTQASSGGLSSGFSSGSGETNIGGSQIAGSAASVGGGVQRKESEEPPLDKVLQTAFGEENLRVTMDVRSNQLILTGSPKILDAAAQLVTALDKPVPQILIQTEIVKVSSDALREMGVDWGGVYKIRTGGTFDYQNNRTRTDPGNVLSGDSGRDINVSGQLTDFNIVLSALIDDGDAQILFSPRVVTQDHKEAFISSGQEIQIPSGLDINGNATFRDRQVTLELGVTPRVLSNSLISLVIRVRNDSINYEQNQISGVPPLNVSTVESFVTLRDGDTVVIGGVVSTQETNSKRRVPLLGDIPVLGRPFRHTSRELQQSELVIMISPTIISDEMGAPITSHPEMIPGEAPQQVLDKFSRSPKELNE
ncbi:MAG TPA: secretin N-terminal domain-containing protein [bacterium]|nr:secretin N-terminal domain-containing protein [bacterium]